MTDIFKGILSPDQLRTVLELAETEAQATGRINDLPDTLTVEIPADVRDNSEALVGNDGA